MQRSTRPLATDFLSTRDFVAAYDQWSQAHGPQGYSRRNFARQAKVRSPNFLTLVISGKRRLRGAWLEAFANGAKLSASERSYLKTLARLEETPEAEEQLSLLDSLEKLLGQSERRPKSLELLSLASGSLAWDLLQLLDLRELDASADELKRRLRRPATVPEIRECLRTLSELGFIEKRVHGGYRLLERHLATPSQFKPAENLRFHRFVLDEAQRALTEVDPSERSFGSLTLGLPRGRIAEFKKEIEVFGRMLVRKYGPTSTAADEVFRLNLQAYPVTRPAKKRNKS